MLQVIWTGDENGLWQGDNRIATLGQLEREGYDLDNFLKMGQKQLATVAKVMTPKPVKLTRKARSIEDMLG